MPRANVELAGKVMDSLGRRDFTAALDALDEDVVLVVDAGVVPTAAGTYHGREAVGKWCADWFRSFAHDYRFEVEEIRSVSERVFAVARHHGRGRASGVEVGLLVPYVFTVQAAKIVRVEMYDSRAKALEAVGLKE
jgi:ketosteroid isomerase-like protein